MLKIDLHIHSEASYDAKASIESILERAQETGLDAVAITDHDRIDESLRATEIADEYGLIAVPGVEVSTSDGHLLALGLEERPKPGNPIDETIQKVRDLGGIAVVPHPFQKTRHGAGAVEDCDAIEIFNSRLLTGFANWKAKRFALKNDISGVAGSDAHTVNMVGRAYTGVKVKENPQPNDITQAIKEGRTETFGSRTPIHLTIKQFAKNAWKRAARTVR